MSKKTDTSLWLHNKLGNVNDLWSAGSICSQLNSEKMKHIRDCFTDLQPLVKLKLLISFLHIPRRNVDEVGDHRFRLFSVFDAFQAIFKAFCFSNQNHLPLAFKVEKRIEEHN